VRTFNVDEGRPACARRYFRLLPIGYLKGLGAERGRPPTSFAPRECFGLYAMDVL
jgi:hypothetical protein